MGRVKVLLIVVTQGIVAIAAVVALIVSVTAGQQSREKAAHDTCELFRHAVLIATPPRYQPRATAFLHRNGLDTARGQDRCNAYAHHLVNQ